MGVGTWKLYTQGKRNIGRGTISLSATTFKLHLAKDDSDAFSGRTTLSQWSQVTNKVTSTSGFHNTTSGEALLAETWTSDGASGYKFDCSVAILTALGTAIASVMYAVITTSAGHLLAVCSLSSAAFTINPGSTLTITIHANGVFNLT